MSQSPPSDWEILAGRPVDERAIVSPEGVVSVGELRDAVLALAGDLRDRGVRQGDRVVTALPNSVDCVVAQLAIRVCGAVLVNLPAQFRREIVEICDQTDARLVVLPAEAVAEPAFATLRDRCFALPRALRSAGSTVAPALRRRHDVAWLAFTSGTTGSPKGAVHTEETLARMVQAMIDRHAVGPDDVVVVAAPMGHAIGFVYGLQLAVRAGCPMAVLPGWDVGVMRELIASHGGTFVAAPTPFLLDVIEAVEAGATEFASLRLFLCGGAPVPAALVARAERALGAGVASAYYGTSEAGAVTTCPAGTAPDKVRTTVGTPLPGMEIRVVLGELQVRGAHVCGRYWGGDVEGRLRAGGWYATGDLGEIDRDGYLSITGRTKELIIRGGVNISPVEIENTLASAANVLEVAVVGVPDPRLGQRVVAAVVARDRQPTLDELRRHCGEHALAKIKWPEEMVVVERLPRTPTGKLLRAQLAEEIER